MLKPCTCSYEHIDCGGSNPLDLKSLFHGLSTKLEKGKKHFKQLYLTNTAIKEIPEKAFEEITFDEIWFYNMTNLSLIHTNAFKGIDSELIEFSVFNTSLKNSPPNHDIFAAISSMGNIKMLQIFHCLIEEIPENAFNGTQNNLTAINLYDNKITKIGNNAFKELNSLSYLDLKENKLDHISENAFSFSKSNDELFRLFLYKNSLNSSSFEKGSFNNLNRPTILILSDWEKLNNITYLDQQIFEEFLNKNKQNRIDSTSIDCNDCRSFWLKKYDKQISDLHCSNYKAFSDAKNFPNCQH